METSVSFMQKLESDYRATSGLPDRSTYKIFYGQVRPASILALGINPGGSPLTTSADGATQNDGRKASASASFFEQDESDLLDCNYRENRGLKALLLPLVSNDHGRLRAEVVRTNLAFRRTATAKELNRPAAYDEAKPFLLAIIQRVSPKLIVLTGEPIGEFTARYARETALIVEELRDPGVGHVVFAAARVSVSGVPHLVAVVQVAHASQFSWTYTKYDVANRIRDLLEI